MGSGKNLTKMKTTWLIQRILWNFMDMQCDLERKAYVYVCGGVNNILNLLIIPSSSTQNYSDIQYSGEKRVETTLSQRYLFWNIWYSKMAMIMLVVILGCTTNILILCYSSFTVYRLNIITIIFIEDDPLPLHVCLVFNSITCKVKKQEEVILKTAH